MAESEGLPEYPPLNMDVKEGHIRLEVEEVIGLKKIKILEEGEDKDVSVEGKHKGSEVRAGEGSVIGGMVGEEEVKADRLALPDRRGCAEVSGDVIGVELHLEAAV
jgi:hypothetical protein